MKRHTVELYFFFGLLLGACVLLAVMYMPFLNMLALSAVVASIFYPLYERIRRYTPKRSRAVASLLSVLAVIAVVVVPISIVGFFLFKEAANVYTGLSFSQDVLLDGPVSFLQSQIDRFFPQFAIDIQSYVRDGTGWLAGSLQTLFAQTAATVIKLFIGLIALYYFFKDGEKFKETLVKFSPLEDKYDSEIVVRLRNTIHSVILGSVTVALIQGVLTAIGFSLFGISNAVLWGAAAALGALIPGIGTAVVFVPAIGFLLVTGMYPQAIGLAIWGAVAVGLIDNLLGPRLMSRGGPLHPLFILLAVLGGLILFGPVGFFLGPLVLSFVIALAHIYTQYVVPEGGKEPML